MWNSTIFSLIWRLKEADEENLVRLTEGAANLAKSVSPPPVPSPNPPQPSSGEEDSDVESLHSYHYSPKGVDMPSAVRLAKRLYMLDGFKKSDVSRHLSKKWVPVGEVLRSIWSFYVSSLIRMIYVPEFSRCNFHFLACDFTLSFLSLWCYILRLC